MGKSSKKNIVQSATGKASSSEKIKGMKKKPEMHIVEEKVVKGKPETRVPTTHSKKDKAPEKKTQEKKQEKKHEEKKPQEKKKPVVEYADDESLGEYDFDDEMYGEFDELDGEFDGEFDGELDYETIREMLSRAMPNDDEEIEEDEDMEGDDDASDNSDNSDNEAEEAEEKKTQKKRKLVSFTDEEATAKDGFLTDLTFSQLGLNPQLENALTELKFSRMSEIQAKSIPPLLAGCDILAHAKTGSGKTLGFLIPCMELLFRAKFKVRNGTGAIIISPTRELAIQIYNVACELSKYTSQTVALLIGGGLRSKEAKKLYKGANIVIATPGRLLDHLLNTDFVFKNLKMLILDEADQILDVGFEEELKAIIRLLPTKRQTLLFSATQTDKIADIAKLAINNKPVYVRVEEKEDTETKKLQQGYIVVSTNKKLMLLLSFLRRNTKKKIIVFFSTCDCVQYYSELFTYINLPVLQLHGKLSQNVRTNAFFQFCNAEKGTLFSTNVAARGLDIPKVDWIIQFDPPHDTREYVHRVGRTARAGRKGKGLLLLTPQTKRYLFHLQDAGVELQELEIGKNLVDIQSQLEDILSTNYYLNEKAVRAFQSTAYAYKNYSDKMIFNMKTFDARGLATQLGLRSVPFIQHDQRTD